MAARRPRWAVRPCRAVRPLKYGHVYFVSIGPNIAKKCEKLNSTKSFLNPRFKGFGAIIRSDSNRALKTVHFGIGEVPKCPTDDRFMKILVFFAIFRRSAGAFFYIPKWSFYRPTTTFLLIIAVAFWTKNAVKI